MRKGIIYVRVSSADQMQGTSLDNQERACLEYARANDIEVVKTYIEKGESATAANRTEFLKALDYCRLNQGQIYAFIVWKIDRFARNTTDHFSVRAKLTQYGVVLQSVTEPITQDHIGKLMETFLAGYAEFENEVRKQRCTGGMQGRLREGIWCWSPPIGYVNSKKAKDRRKTTADIPDEERFYFIQKGLRLYLQGNHSITALADESNQWGLTTRTGRPMPKQLWEKILTDKFYAGILVDPWSGEEFQGLHKPMITRAEYEQIQVVKRGKSSNATNARLSDNPDFPLRRFVRCECGHPFTASWSTGRKRRYPFYHCHNKQCGLYGRCIAKDTLELAFQRLLATVAPSPEFLEFFRRTVMDCTNERHTVKTQEKTHRQHELGKLEARRKGLLEMRLNKEISPEEYAELKGAVDRQVTRLTALAATGLRSISDLEAILSGCVALLQDLAGTWKTMPLRQKQRLQKAVLPEGINYQKSSGQFGTAILSPIFKLNGKFSRGRSGLVAEIRRDWDQIITDIETIHTLISETVNSKFQR